MTKGEQIAEELRYLNHITGLEKVLRTANEAADYILKLEAVIRDTDRVLEGILSDQDK